MKTTTLCENGNTYQITYKEVEDKPVNPKNNYITIDSELFEVISKIQTDESAVTESMHLGVIKDLDEKTKVSLHYLPGLIKDLGRYDDEYSKKLLTVFCSYQEHKNFDQKSPKLKKINPKNKIKHFNVIIKLQLYFVKKIVEKRFKRKTKFKVLIDKRNDVVIKDR